MQRWKEYVRGRVSTSERDMSVFCLRADTFELSRIRWICELIVASALHPVIWTSLSVGTLQATSFCNISIQKTATQSQFEIWTKASATHTCDCSGAQTTNERSWTQQRNLKHGMCTEKLFKHKNSRIKIRRTSRWHCIGRRLWFTHRLQSYWKLCNWNARSDLFSLYLSVRMISSAAVVFVFRNRGKKIVQILGFRLISVSCCVKNWILCGDRSARSHLQKQKKNNNYEKQRWSNEPVCLSSYRVLQFWSVVRAACNASNG